MRICKIIPISIIFFTANVLFSQTNENLMYVNALEGLRVRTSPNINGQRIGLLRHLTEVTVIREDSAFITLDNIRGKWVFVRTFYDDLENKVEGWVFNGYLMNRNELDNYLSKIIVEQKSPQNNIVQKIIGSWIMNNNREVYKFNINGSYFWGKVPTSLGENGKWYIKDNKLFLEGVISDLDWSEKTSHVYQLNFIGDSILLLTLTSQGSIIHKVYLKEEEKMLSINELEKKEEEISMRIKALKSNTEGVYPVIDGVIDIEKYLDVKTKYRILWILKEVNFGDNPKSPSNWNMADFYKNATLDEIKKILTAKRMMLATARILSNLDALEAFESVACINIKKLPGGNHTKDNDTEIQQAYNVPENRKILLDQIEAYSPDIVICGNTLQYFEKDIPFRQGEAKSIEMGNHHYFCTKERLYINAFHPAYLEITDNGYAEKIYNAFSYWEEKYRK